MKKWRYVVVSGAALSWGGCADLPSFPEGLYNTRGGGATGSSGSGTVIPNAGTSTTTTAGTGNSTGGTSTGTGGTGSTSGGASGATTVGTGSGGTASGVSGSGGMMANPQAEIDDAVKALNGWRYENPCGAVDGHTLTDGQCNSGEICWPNGNKAHFAEKKVIQIGGVVGHQYDVTLRIRGAIEPRDYPAACTFLPGGPANQATIGIIENCDGFSNSGQVQFNVYQFAIEEPKHVYYLNAVKLHPPHRVDSIDQTWTIRVAGGTKINFDFDDINGGEIRNCSVTVPDIQPYPKSFDGNFFQLDVVDARLAP